MVTGQGDYPFQDITACRPRIFLGENSGVDSIYSSRFDLERTLIYEGAGFPGKIPVKFQPTFLTRKLSTVRTITRGRLLSLFGPGTIIPNFAQILSMRPAAERPGPTLASGCRIRRADSKMNHFRKGRRPINRPRQIIYPQGCENLLITSACGIVLPSISLSDKG